MCLSGCAAQDEWSLQCRQRTVAYRECPLCLAAKAFWLHAPATWNHGWK